MTDPLGSIRARIDAGQRQLKSAHDMICNADTFRNQAARLGFPVEAREEAGRIVLSFDDPTASRASVLTSPRLMPSSDLHDAGKPYPAVRDDYQPPAEEPSSPSPAADCAHGTTARVHSTGETECVSCKAPVEQEAAPEPAPKPAPRDLPPIKDHHGKPVPVAAKRPWTDEDKADLIARVARGETAEVIAEATGRSLASVRGKIGSLQARRLPEHEAATEVTTPVAEPVSERPVPTSAGVTTPAAHSEPDDSGWSRAEDLELLRLLSSGKSPRVTAEQMGRSIDDVLRRRRELVPSRHPRDLSKLYYQRRAEAERGAVASA